MPNRGRFIVVEGLEGAGKSTAIRTIQSLLTRFAAEVITTREPGGTKTGEAIRTIIKDTNSFEVLSSKTELLLMYAARTQLIEQVIRPSLQAGRWVLADRFDLSSFAYQGGGRKLGFEMIEALSALCLDDVQPDVILFLDIPPQLGLERARKRGKYDRIEQESLSFFQDVYVAYQEKIKYMDNVIQIDATQPLKTVQSEIKTKLENQLLKYTNAISN